MCNRYISVVKSIPKSKYYNGPGLAAAKFIRKGVRYTAYAGRKWVVGDENIPEDNSYQTILPGTNFIIDSRVSTKGS